MKVDVVYTEEFRRKATIDVDEDQLRDWLGDVEGGGKPFKGEITRDHLRAWLNEIWDDPDLHWPPCDPPHYTEFEHLDVESAQPSKEG